MSNLVKVKWFTKTKSQDLNEIYQQTGMVFSFVSSPKDGLYQCHEWVKCRDFLQDVVRGQITKKKFSIYGFSFNTKDNPNVDLSKMRMLVAKNDLKSNKISAFKKKIASCVKLLNHFEDMAKVGKTTVVEIDPSGQDKYNVVFLFTGSSMWLKSPFLVSMYSFLIRLGDKEIGFKDNQDLKKKLKVLVEKYVSGSTNDNDIHYLTNCWDKLDLIIKNRSKIFLMENGVHDIYTKKYSIDSFHSRSGIDSLSRCATVDKILNTSMNTLIEGD